MSHGMDDDYGELDPEMPPEGCQHYTDSCEMPWDIEKSISMRFVHSLYNWLMALDITTNVTVSSRNMMKAYG